MARKYSNTSVETTLVNSINSSETSIQINDLGGLPASFPYSIILDYQGSTVEVVTVTNVAGSNLTVTRGQDGTSAQSHDAGAVVVHGATARDLSEPQLHIDATSDVHGLAGGAELVGTDTTQTLTNKTIAFAANSLTDVAGIDAVQTLTNKTMSGVSNTFSGIPIAAITGGTPDVQVFTTSGTWNKPPDARLVWVRSQGAGGGGGGSFAVGNLELSAGTGGGGGAYAESFLDANTLGAAEAVTVGAGGAGSASADGLDGGLSSFGAHVIADHGFGGSVAFAGGNSPATSTRINGGLASQSTGQVTIDGGDGGFSIRLNEFDGMGGSGGASILSTPVSGTDEGDTSAQAGADFGGGGAGALSRASAAARAGGAGGDGVVVVVTFF